MNTPRLRALKMADAIRDNWSISDVAKAEGISPQRVGQVLESIGLRVTDLRPPLYRGRSSKRPSQVAIRQQQARAEGRKGVEVRCACCGQPWSGAGKLPTTVPYYCRRTAACRSARNALYIRQRYRSDPAFREQILAYNREQYRARRAQGKPR